MIELTEEYIRKACLEQCLDKYDTYEEWADNHMTGTVDRIRRYIVEDYNSGKFND